MRNELVKQQVEKIMQDGSYPFPKNVAMVAAWLCIYFKGTHTKVLTMGDKSSLCDFFVLASAQNPMQAQTMADWIGSTFKQLGFEVKSREGSRESDWILLDMGHVIVHIFLEESRMTYALDALWVDAPQVKIPEDFYFDRASEDTLESGADLDNYF